MLWNRFSDHVRNFVRRKVSDRKDAEDVLQDIFMRIHRGLPGLESRERLQSWVFGIARRALADYYRKKNREREEPVGAELPADAGAGADADTDTETGHPVTLAEFEGEHDVHEEVLSWLIPMIEELPEKYREPLKMADVKGIKQQEIADRLGLSLSGAKSRVQRAREKLGEVLAACCAVEFGEAGRAVSYRKLEDDTEDCDDC